MSNEKEAAPRTIAASDVRFSWAEGVSTPAYDRWYHWLVDCPEVLVATWYAPRSCLPMHHHPTRATWMT